MGPTTLPISTRNVSDSYTSSLNPNSPGFHSPSISHSRERERSSSPPRSFPRPPESSRRLSHAASGGAGVNRGKMSSFSSVILRHIRPYLTPRVVSSLLLWAAALWTIHSFLLPLPVPKLSRQRSAVKASDHHLSTTYPPPPLRQGDDHLDSVDPLWRPLSPLPPPEAPFPRLRPTKFLPPRCLEQWFADGETLCGKGEMGEEETLDATWLWVNGTDHRWRDSMVKYREEAGVYSPEHHFREQNELVHSMRSVLDALPGHLRTFHLILADFPFDAKTDVSLLPPGILTSLEASVKELGKKKRDEEHPIARRLSDTDNSTEVGLPERGISSISPSLAEYLKRTWRVAQTPTWLDFSRRDVTNPSHPYHPYSAHKYLEERGQLHKAEVRYPSLRYATHSEIFRLPTMERDAVTQERLGEHEWREREWRKKALPSFNSMAIESRVGWLPGLADVTLSLNDDFFLLRPHAVSDFHSPLYGSVIRFDHGYYQQVRPMLDKSRFNDAGEVGGLYHANYILSQRFPRRLRPYFAHVPKVITRGLHHEASLMFKEALTGSSERRFREMKSGEGDIQMQWLLTSLRVERWREALLWTFVVANMGTLESTDQWTDATRRELRDMFGLGEGDDDVVKIEVHRGERWTLESGRMDRAFEQAGWEAPKATEFLWSSMDGHMPPILKSGTDPTVNDRCLLDLDRCFGSFWTREEDVSSADMFKRLTFQYPECGNCMIMALVTASGPLGLSAFFPLKDTTFSNPPLVAGLKLPKYLPPPHLPLTSTWQEANFSLQSVMSTTALPGEVVDLREYCMKLLSRYQYLSAKSVSHFHMLKSAEHAHRVFKMIQDNPKVSILGLNDDIEQDYDDVKDIMNDWFELRWPRKAVWERDWDPTKDRYTD